ncbi:unnamed protein product, partial [Prorocentrum cordatum]
ETVMQVGPRLDSKSKGPIEAAGGGARQLVRILARTVNARYKVELKPGDPICTWLARHAGWALARFTVREDGSTPCRRIMGRGHRGQIVEFAETAMHKLPAGSAGKMEARWDKGIWPGKANVSDEHMIGTPRGSIFSRSIARRPDEKRWNKHLFGQIARAPSGPKATLLAAEPVLGPRNLTKAILARLGRAPGCPACDETGQCNAAECGAGAAGRGGQPAQGGGAGAAAREAEGENAETMGPAPIEIAARSKRQVFGKKEVPESKKARTVRSFFARVAPPTICAVDLTKCAAEPVNETDLTNIDGALSGQLLPADKAMEGRARERAKMKERTVFKRAFSHGATGNRARGKWLQGWKRGAGSKMRRSVATQVARQVRDDAFAGTPPLKFARLALAMAASFERGQMVYLIGLWGISDAVFRAAMDEGACAVPPAGEDDPNVARQLLKAMCGARLQVAAMVFFHFEKGICAVVHGDDFAAAATRVNPLWLNEVLEELFEVKRFPFIGPSQAGGGVAPGKLLGRTARWSGEGLHWEKDTEHVVTVAAAYRKLAATREISPASRNVGEDVSTALGALSYKAKKAFQSVAPTALYLAADRPGAHFSTSWIMRGTQGPMEIHGLELQRLSTHLATCPRMTWHFERQEMPTEIAIVTDSDWAGDEVARRSRGGGFERAGEARIDSWAGQRAPGARSSGEAEHAGVTNGAVRGISAKHRLEEMLIGTLVTVAGDST